MSKQPKMSNYKKLTFIFLLATLLSFFLLHNLGKTTNKKLYSYVNYESKRIVSNIVNYSINETLEENINTELFNIKKNNRGEIELLDYNTKEVNRLLKILNQNIQTKLIKLEDGKIKDFPISNNLIQSKLKNIKSGILCEVPIGTLKNNAIFANLGPKIPIRMSFIGAVSSYINTKVTEYGFNSLVVEVNIHVEIEEKITLPTSSKVNTLKIKAPLTLEIIQGIIPEYYYTKGLEKNSNQYILQ